MRRLAAMLGSTALLLACGCGVKSYEFRLDKTLENMRYQDRLNRLLNPAETKGKWESLGIYIRPPKALAAAKGFLLTPPEPGKFELEASFLEAEKQSLHVLARVKLPKAAKKKTDETKKGEEPAAPPAERRDFYTDVLDVLIKAYPNASPEDIVISKFKPATEKNNDYKRHVFTANDRNVETYFYKSDPYEVALVFEYPKADLSALVAKIKLCLESFAVGDKARRLFSGSGSEDEGAAGPGGPVAF